MRKRPMTLVAALSAAVLAIPMAPAAAAAVGGPTVHWASSVSGDLGTLQVSASADAGIGQLRAFIVSYATGADVAVVTDFALHSGDVRQGIWRTPAPLQLADLGGYRVDVEATDAAGQQAPRTQVGSLTYAVATAFSPFTVSPAVIDYAHRTVQVSGTFTGKWPATREIRPIANAPVYISAGWGQNVDVTTGADGTFAASVELSEPTSIRAEFSYDPSRTYLMRATSDSVEVVVDQARAKLTAKLSKAEIRAGETVTLSGALTWHSPTGWQPLADEAVGVMFCVSEDYCPWNADEPVVTGADGRYQITVTPYQTGFYQVGFGSEDPFIADAMTTAAVVVLQPATFTDFTASRDEAGAVTARGHMVFGTFTPWPIPVQIQHRAEGAAEWATVATVDNAQWDGAGYAFAATVAGPAAGKWRAYYAGKPDFFQSAKSDTVFVP